MPTDPIRIRPGEDGRLIVHVPYSSDHVAKIKTVVGRRRHQQEKHWTVPQTTGAITHLLEAGYDIRTVQKLRGHSDVRTTMMIYTYVLNHGGRGVQSPADRLLSGVGDSC